LWLWWQALVSLVRQRFLLHESAAAADRMRKAEELLMDFLTHEGQPAFYSQRRVFSWGALSVSSQTLQVSGT
jgi:hypothetical protein